MNAPEPNAGVPGSGGQPGGRPWRQRRIERFLGRVTEELLNLTDDATRNIGNLAAVSGELLEAEGVVYLSFATPGRSLRVAAQWGLPEGAPIGEWGRTGIGRAVLEEGSVAPRVFRQLRADALHREDPLVQGFGWETCVGCAVIHGGAPRGVLLIGHRRDREPNDDELRVASLLAVAIGQQDIRSREQETLRVKDWAVESTLWGIATADVDGRVIYVNPAILRMWRFATAGEVVGRHITEFWKDARNSGPVMTALATSGAFVGELDALRADGSSFPVQLMATVVRDRDGRPVATHGFVIDVTERKRAETALRESEYFLHRSQAVGHIGSYKMDIQAGTWICTRELEEIFGIPPDHPKTVSGWLELVPPEEREAMRSYLLEHVVAGRNRFDREYRIVRRSDGELRWVDGSGVLEFDATGQPCRMIGTIQDITDRKRTEERVRIANRQLRMLGECNEALIREHDETRLLQTVCRLIVETGGYRMAWVGMAEDDADRTVRPVAWAKVDSDYLANLRVSWGDSDFGRGPVGLAVRTGRVHVVHDIAQEAGFTAWRAAAAQRGTRAVCATPLVHEGRAMGAISVHSGEPQSFDVEETCLLQKLADNLAFGIVALREHRQHERAELARREAEGLYRAAVQTFPDGVSVVQPDGRLQYASPKALEIYGVDSLEAAVGRSMLEFIDPVDHGRALENFMRLQTSGEVELHEYRLRRADGSTFVGEIAAAALTDAEGRATGVLAVTRDVTERRRAEDLLRRMQTSVDLARDPVFWIDQAGRHTYANEAACRSLGYTREELCQLTVSDIDPNFPREKWADHWAKSRERGAYSIETLHRAKDGRTFPVEVAINFMRFEGQEFHCAFVRDLTERKRSEQSRLELERRLLHAQKLESLGVLAGGIAHDFNNLLMGILGNLDLALMDLPEDSPARGSIDQSVRAARRATELTRQMLAYSGRGAFEVREIDLAALVAENAHLFRATIPKLVTLRIETDPQLPRIIADSSQVQQVVMNLITNASEAIGDRAGQVHLRTTVADFDAKTLAQSRCDEIPEPGRYVVLEVTDTGCGMDAATQERLFEPFFTTKFTGRGLGMSAILGIVRGHKGAILVYSRVGLGTRIRVLFPAGPVVEPAAPATPVTLAAAPATPARKKGTVLVVDDEVVVRRVCRAMLERNGWETLEAGDGPGAIEMFTARAADIQGVLLDLSMPRMNGLEVFRELRRLRPEVRVVLSSGANAAPEYAEKLKTEGVAGFLHKPFTAESLLREAERAFGV
ncbi:MAG: PAS domain S-box protein [Verrucomicrobia bacterium]|nr:PAS domain S-box protein [Verrucomicrobiota bacterium]